MLYTSHMHEDLEVCRIDPSHLGSRAESSATIDVTAVACAPAATDEKRPLSR